MKASNNLRQDGRVVARTYSQEKGFTLIETAIALVIMAALEANAGNKSRTAEDLGVSYKTLLNKIKDYSL